MTSEPDRTKEPVGALTWCAWIIGAALSSILVGAFASFVVIILRVLLPPLGTLGDTKLVVTSTFLISTMIFGAAYLAERHAEARPTNAAAKRADNSLRRLVQAALVFVALLFAAAYCTMDHSRPGPIEDVPCQARYC